MIRILLISFVFITSFSSSLLAKLRSFEGNINFVRETVFDTTHIAMMVKDNMVRVDEFDSNRKLISCQIINLKEEEVIALSSDKKLYAQVPVTPRIANGTNSIEISKTANHKQINGYTCYQWRVKDVKRNTEIAYWVFEERFDFFESLIQLLNRTEYSLTAFIDIPEKGGFFPMLTEERTLLRKDKLRIAVVDICEKSLQQSLFEIPSDYKSAKR